MTDAERDELWLKRVQQEDAQQRQQEAHIQRMFEQNERIIELLTEISERLAGLGDPL